MAYLGQTSLPFDPTRSIPAPRDADRFSGNGSTTSFTLSRSVNAAVDIEVFVENVQQEPLTAYDVNGTSLNFTGAPPSGTNNVYVVYRNFQSGAQVTMPDGSVTYSKLANNLRIFTTDNLTPNGNNSVFTLGEPPADANTVMVTVDGIIQRAPVHYTTSGSTITFTSAPAAGSNVHVRHLGFRTSTTVTQLAANSTISQPTIQTPVITGTVTGGATFQAPTINAASITGNTAIPNGSQLVFNSASVIFDIKPVTGAADSLQLRSTYSGTTKEGVRVDYLGRVSMPSNPKFEAVRSGNMTFTPTNQTQVMIYNSEVVNIGGHYSTSTGLFTAPVAGMYAFFAGAYTPSLGMSQCWFIRNGSRTKSLTTVNTANGTTSGSGLVYLDANDTLGVHFYSSTGGTTDMYANSEHTFFYGALIG